MPAKTTFVNGVEALKDALRTEASVTKSIRRVIEKCENDNSNNDYHVSVSFNIFRFVIYLLTLIMNMNFIKQNDSFTAC